VVAPLTTIANWQREAELWVPQMNVVAYTGGEEARTVIRNQEVRRVFLTVFPVFRCPVSCLLLCFSASFPCLALPECDSQTLVFFLHARFPPSSPIMVVQLRLAGSDIRADIVLAPYQLVLSDAKYLSKVQWACVVVDEGVC